jgi:hypothetical protein
MNPLQNFLERFSALLKNSKLDKETIKNIIKSQTNIDLEEKDIEIKDGILYTKTSPMVRNTLFMNKKKLLEVFQKEFGKKAPKDIR